MIQLLTCTACGGFLALSVRSCPHCHRPLERTRQALLGLAALAGGGAVSMTLMACYGGACTDGGCPDAASDDDVSAMDASTDAAPPADAADAADAGDAPADVAHGG